ncbi:MAG: type II toxin-antitoxin system VapC family toxin [Anaerolineales bacterium]|nr:type II toxin-antitoxin system VapC family toxin [Anaerolineales bacterium]
MSASTTLYVLDSFALLAYLGGEAGEGRVNEILHETSRGDNRTLMSLINLGEVVYITERERGLAKAQEALAIIEQLPIEVLSVDRQVVLGAAHVKANYPVAYADAFAITAAQANDGVLVTGDPEFEAVKDFVRIEWIGERSTSR